MAKRKRLTPAQPDHFSGPAPETKSLNGPGFTAPPIAQVAGDTATHAALNEVTGVLQDARAQGRLIEALPLAAINAHYLVRDRLVQDDEDMASLMASLRARGQQTAIEVTALPGSDQPTSEQDRAFGLISGWRRLEALNRLYQETKDAQFSTVKALVVNPASARDAYVAMVEENEIRVNLSLFERANIARRAAEQGIYPTPRHAVLGLFESVSRSKRSKINSFVPVAQALASALRFPAAISEKLGLALAKALAADPGLVKIIREGLSQDAPQSASEELAILSRMMAPASAKSSDAKQEEGVELDTNQGKLDSNAPAPLRPGEITSGLHLRLNRSAHIPRIEVSGPEVNDALFHDLRQWLADRYK